jgi:3-oxoacyl-[acyl-carrier-protein] synthase-1
MDATKQFVMKQVYVLSDNIFSPLGYTSNENFDAVKNGKTAIQTIDKNKLFTTPFVGAAFKEFPVLENSNNYTRFEQLCMLSIQEAMQNIDIDLTGNDTIFILSTTKGNIELIEKTEINDTLRNRVSLPQTAQKISNYFSFSNTPIVLSNACISGVLAVIVAKRFLENGQYKQAVICGADILSPFVVSGFQSLHAMSTNACKPFDKNRDGINLGEAAATLILTTQENLLKSKEKIVVKAGASSNDANHISGPSRTGLELGDAVRKVLLESAISEDELSFISAHGTATIYNDEMESKAFASAGLSEVPLHSLKGYFGHTLGAAGLLESILTIYSLKEHIILASKNFEELGVPEKVNVNKDLRSSDKNHALKTASGFGGCNAAIVYSLEKFKA